MVTDRDVLVAIFIAVTAIGEHLTGERMTLSLTSESGEIFEIAGSKSVKWTPIEPREEVAAHPAPSPVPLATRQAVAV
jgi:hypothetical protein